MWSHALVGGLITLISSDYSFVAWFFCLVKVHSITFCGWSFMLVYCSWSHRLHAPTCTSYACVPGCVPKYMLWSFIWVTFIPSVLLMSYLGPFHLAISRAWFMHDLCILHPLVWSFPIDIHWLILAWFMHVHVFHHLIHFKHIVIQFKLYSCSS